MAIFFLKFDQPWQVRVGVGPILEDLLVSLSGFVEAIHTREKPYFFK
jgi:hypothetical protein